jgi:hypothetical protein
MQFKDVKVGMRVKANSKITGFGEGYVKPNDFGTVIYKGEQIKIQWNNPINKQNECKWWTDSYDIEPVYKKSEMVSNYIRVLRDDDGDLIVNRLYKIRKTVVGELKIEEDGYHFSDWSNEISEEFVQADLLNLYNGACDFQYVLKEDVEKSKPQTKTEPNAQGVIEFPEVNTSFGEIKVIEIGETEAKPIIEETDEELVIYCGRHTIYYHKQFDALGTSACNPVDTYDKYVGKAIAGFRALSK